MEESDDENDTHHAENINQYESSSSREITPNVRVTKVTDKVKYRLAGNETWMESEIVSRGGKSTAKHRMWFNIRDKGEEQLKSLNFASDQVEWEHASESIHGGSLSWKR